MAGSIYSGATIKRQITPAPTQRHSDLRTDAHCMLSLVGKGKIRLLCLRDDLNITEYELPDQTRFRSIGCRCTFLMMEMSGWTESNLVLPFTLSSCAECSKSFSFLILPLSCKYKIE